MIPTWEKERKRAEDVARSDYRGALPIARAIADPWYRCQALCHAAMHCQDKSERTTIVIEAVHAADWIAEPNRHVVLSSWIVRVLAAWEMQRELDDKIDELLAVIAREPSPVRRAYALDAILGAIEQGPKFAFLRVLDPFAQSCLISLQDGKRNRRGESYLASRIELIWKFSPDDAERLARGIQGPVLRARAMDEIDWAKGQKVGRAD